jgi:hypothetical protein
VDVRHAPQIAKLDAESCGRTLGRIQCSNERVLPDEGLMRSQRLECAEAAADSAGGAYGGAEHASGRLRDADVPLAGGARRMPARADAAMRPVGALLTTRMRGASVAPAFD